MTGRGSRVAGRASHIVDAVAASRALSAPAVPLAPRSPTAADARAYAASADTALARWLASVETVGAAARQAGDVVLLHAAETHVELARTLRAMLRDHVAGIDAAAAAPDAASALARIVALSEAVVARMHAAAREAAQMIAVDHSCEVWSAAPGSGGVLASVTIALRPLASDALRLVRARVALGEIEVLDTRAARDGDVAEETVATGLVVPGTHDLTVELRYDREGAATRPGSARTAHRAGARRGRRG